MEHVDVVILSFSGERAPSVAGLQRTFGLDEPRAGAIVDGVPRTVKRSATLAEADRYVRALESFGAVVQCQPTTTTRAETGAQASASLPPPSLQDVEHETKAAVERWRDSERPKAPPTSELMPEIPRAARLPSNLESIPDTRPAGESIRPEWMMDADEESKETQRRSMRPDRAPSDGLELGAAPTDGTGTAPADEPFVVNRTNPPASRVGITDASALQRTSRVRSDPPPASPLWLRMFRSRTVRMALAAGLLAYVAFKLPALLDDPADNRRARWSEAGIEVAEHAEAQQWLTQSGHGLATLDAASGKGLIEGLMRAGAVSVFATRIHPGADGESLVADALVVELPRDPERRRTVLWQTARAQGRQASVQDDHSQQFQQIVLARQ